MEGMEQPIFPVVMASCAEDHHVLAAVLKKTLVELEALQKGGVVHGGNHVNAELFLAGDWKFMA